MQENETQAAEQRTAAAEQRAVEAEQRAARLEAMPRTASMYRPPLEMMYDYRDEAGICRVCARPAPSQHAARQDNLRVCAVRSAAALRVDGTTLC